MKSGLSKTAACAALALASALLASGSAAHAEVPSWIRDNAGYWADGVLDDRAFLDGMAYLVERGVVEVPDVDARAAEGDGSVPPWIKSNAALWASGQIGDSDFLSGMGYLVAVGVIAVGSADADSPADSDSPERAGSQEAGLEARLEACSQIKKALKRLDCQQEVRQEMLVLSYKSSVEPLRVGPVSYYWAGLGGEGNSFETSPTGQAILSVRMLAENTSEGNVSLSCTSPQICAYDVWDGQSAFKYSGMDFTNGQILLKPGQAREFNMLFGPNIGYGGTQFLHDPSRDYEFRISESFGSASIPLDLG